MATPRRKKFIVFGALAALLIAHAGLLIHCAISKSASYDEGPHIAAGLAYLRYHEMSIYNHSPPAVRMWAALPAYLAGARIPPAKPFRDYSAGNRRFAYFEQFQSQNTGSIHQYVLYGRFMLLPVALALLLLIYRWAAELYGSASGLAAAAVWAFTPTVIENASTVGTDIPVTLFILLSVWTWLRFLAASTPRRVVAAALCIAIAQTIKFTALLLWPALLLLAILRCFSLPLKQRLPMLKQWTVGIALCIIVTSVFVNGIYGFRMMGERVGSFDFESSTMRRLQTLLPQNLPLPFHRDMIYGVDAQKWDAEAAYPATLTGSDAYFGSDWRYYPLLLATKLPVCVLCLSLLTLASFCWRGLMRQEVAVVAIIHLFAVGMITLAQMNVGLRYLLPVIAPIMVLSGRCVNVQNRRTKFVVMILLAGTVIETVMASPRMHSFQNFPARQQRTVLLDLDNGEGLIALRRWLQSHGEPRIALLYVGTALASEYRIDSGDPFTLSAEDKYLVISRLFLDGLPAKTPDGFAFLRPWRNLRTATPVADLGGLLVFDLADLRDPAPVVRIQTWDDALKLPELIPLRNLDERRLKGR